MLNSQDPINILPINGGNSIAVNEYLRAMQDANLDLWLILLDQLRYERNLFTIENDKELNKAWCNIETCLYWQGVCAIQKIDNMIVVYQLNDLKVDNSNDIISAKGTPFVNLKRNSQIQNISLNRNNAVFFRRNQEAWCDWVFWFYRYKELVLIKKYIFVNLQGSQKKVIINAQGEMSDVMKKEILHLKNPDTWYILNNSISDLPIKSITDDFREIDIPNESEKLFSAFDRWLNFIYYHKGRRYNVSYKPERNIVDEVQLNTVNFDLMEKDKMDWLKQGIDNYNSLYTRNATIIKTFDLIDKEIELEDKSETEVKNDDI